MALAFGAGGIAGAGAVALARRLRGVKRRRSSLTVLMNRVKRKMLKIKNIQLDRRLFREQMKGV
jgi:hypothetical protein